MRREDSIEESDGGLGIWDRTSIEVPKEI